MTRERGDRFGDLLARGRIGDRPVGADGVPRQRDARAGCLDDVGVDVAEHLAQRVVRVRAAGGRGRSGCVDPCDRLAVRAAVAHRPLEQVLQRSGQRAGVLGRAQQHARRAATICSRRSATAACTGCPSRSSSGLKCGRSAMPPYSVVVTPSTGELGRRPKHRGVRRASRRLPEISRTCSDRYIRLMLVGVTLGVLLHQRP